MADGRPDTMDLMYQGLGQGNQAYQGLSGLNSQFAGINTAKDVQSQYGLTDIQKQFAPLFKMLSNQNANERRAAQFRVGRSASPEMTFSNLGQNAELGMTDLLGKQGQAQIGREDFIANLLGQAKNANNAFGLNKFQGLSGMADRNFNNSLNLSQFNRAGEGPSFLDILGTVAGAAAPFLGGPIAGAAGTAFNFLKGGNDPNKYKSSLTVQKPTGP
jgi:hypothetical protein